jgi:hypothetical protein
MVFSILQSNKVLLLVNELPVFNIQAFCNNLLNHTNKPITITTDFQF